MAFSGGIVAGVAVGCAVASFVLGAIVMTWLYRVALSEEVPPDPYAHEKFLHKLVEHVSLVVQPDMAQMVEWDLHTWHPYHTSLHFSVRNFVYDYATGCALDGDSPHDLPPVDSHLLHSLSGGAGEDWGKIYTTADLDERCRLLTHFIARVLYLRMIPNGDCKITLLPPDMLSTYQCMLTKVPTEFMAEGRDAREQEKSTQALLQCWRIFTVYRCSEPRDLWWGGINPSAVQRTGFVRTGWSSSAVSQDDKYDMYEDDPRMPNILALESTLIDALTPFWPAKNLSGKPVQFKPFEDPKARRALRSIAGLAAELAIIAFSRPEPMEFFWPPGNVREGPPLYESSGAGLEFFGVRRRVPVPGCESEEHKRGVGTVVEIRPKYRDSGHIETYLNRGGLMSLMQEIRAAEDIRKEQGDEESEQNKERRRVLEKELEAIKAVMPFQMKTGVETPGWDGATNIF